MTYTIRDVCAKYGVHEHAVLTWIHSGELKAINVGRAPGKKKPRWRIREDDLRAFEELRAATPPPPKKKRRKRQSDVVEFY